MQLYAMRELLFNLESMLCLLGISKVDLVWLAKFLANAFILQGGDLWVLYNICCFEPIVVLGNLVKSSKLSSGVPLYN